MKEREKAVRKFRRASEQRWLAAHWLFTESEFYVDSIYLAGYAVECALKSLILHRTPSRSFNEIYEEITTGKKAHDYEFLKWKLQRRPVNLTIPKPVQVSFWRVATWSTDLRYESSIVEYDEAKEFLRGASEIRAWVEKEL